MLLRAAYCLTYIWDAVRQSRQSRAAWRQLFLTPVILKEVIRWTFYRIFRWKLLYKALHQTTHPLIITGLTIARYIQQMSLGGRQQCTCAVPTLLESIQFFILSTVFVFQFSCPGQHPSTWPQKTTEVPFHLSVAPRQFKFLFTHNLVLRHTAY